MACFVVCIVAGLWQFYNFVTYIHPEYELPFIMLMSQEATICRVVNMLCLNWAPIIGTLLMVFGVVGILTRKSENANFEGFKYFMMAFSLIYSILLML